MKELTPEQQRRVLEDLRYYGNEVAGNAPVGGYVSACKRAEKHWYAVTLPLLMELNAVYDDDRYNTLEPPKPTEKVSEAVSRAKSVLQGQETAKNG